MNIFTRALAKFAGKLVLPAQFLSIDDNKFFAHRLNKLFFNKKLIDRIKNNWQLLEKHNHQLQKSDNKEDQNKALDINRFYVKSSDTSELDTITLKAKRHKNPKRYVIYGWGRTGFYENHLEDLAADALNLHANIISFNYRGVGKSTGAPVTEDDLVQDYITQVERLLEQGVSPSDITCYGHSMGAAIATLAAAKLHATGIKVKLYNDRSFNTLLDSGVEMFLGNRSKHRHAIVRIFATTVVASVLAVAIGFGALTFPMACAIYAACLSSFFIKPISHFIEPKIANFLKSAQRWLMSYLGWTMDAVTAYDSIEDQHKSVVVLHGPTDQSKTKSKLGILNIKEYNDDPKYREDRTVDYAQSIVKNSQKIKQKRRDLNEELANLENIENPSSLILNRIQKVKQDLTDLSNSKATGGHHSSRPKHLMIRYNSTNTQRQLNGQERFYGFIEPHRYDNADKDPRTCEEFFHPTLGCN